MRSNELRESELFKALEKRWMQTRYRLVRWLNTKGPTGRPRWQLLLWLFGLSSVFGSLFLLLLSLYRASLLRRRKKSLKKWREELETALLDVDWKADETFDVRPPQPQHKFCASVVGGDAGDQSRLSSSIDPPRITKARSEKEARAVIFDVCVVGGGPAGSSCAAHLARGGLNVLLLDRHPFPKDKICGDRWNPLSQLHLESLGLTSFVLNEGLAKWVWISFLISFLISLLTSLS